MQIKKEFILREIAGDYVLVPVGKTMGEFTGLFPLSETGAFIWKLLPDVETEMQIVDSLLENYEINRETAEEDVSDFIAELKKFGIL